MRYLENVYRDFRQISENENCQLTGNCTRADDVLYIPAILSGCILKFDLKTEAYAWIWISDIAKPISACAWDGTYFYFAPLRQDVLLRWDGQDVVEYPMPQECTYEEWGPSDANIIDGKLVLQGNNCDTIVFDLEDMTCYTEPVRYSYSKKMREDA